jgi:hypothetical protein
VDDPVTDGEDRGGRHAVIDDGVERGIEGRS